MDLYRVKLTRAGGGGEKHKSKKKKNHTLKTLIHPDNVLLPFPDHLPP